MSCRRESRNCLQFWIFFSSRRKIATPLSDGLIAAALFLWFLERNDALLKADGTPRVSNETLVALTLMIAESRPEEKDILVRILMHLLVGGD